MIFWVYGAKMKNFLQNCLGFKIFLYFCRCIVV